MAKLIERLRFRAGIECAACKERGAPAGLFICAGDGPWYCANR